MAKLEVRMDVGLRSEMGRFIAACDAAATETVKEAVEEGERDVIAAAPNGPARSDYGRRPKLKASIRGALLDSRSGTIVAQTPHAGPQEFGAGPHEINGRAHPGNPARHFMAPVVARIAKRLMQAAEKNYPG